MSSVNLAIVQRQPVHLHDYHPPAWRVVSVALEFDLDAAYTEVQADLELLQDPEQADTALYLHGEVLELLEIALDGRTLSSGDYQLDENGLTLPQARSRARLRTRVRIAPQQNTALQGLYLSGSHEAGFLLTQCEAEGFRRITYFTDRPDVLACYKVTLRAERARYPVLLANGNPDGAGDLPQGRHWVRWLDPHPKPSYLFALVAGKIEYIEDHYRTSDGRDVCLRIYAEENAIARCKHAMQSLKRAMRWDEEHFGRAYDLDVFNIVATHDFTMGAMENKGLNIFNAKYLLADPQTSTDEDYAHVEAVVAHEYFHNWTGNRVTCRDWFQLSLKEGLTVYREQEFCADIGSRSLKRIEDVQTLWRTQFTEDAGPLAHPVRPEQYLEINNFYTATVYEKGAEIVRMLAVTLGHDGFRRGMDLYFERHDGQAVTVEDFLSALADANAVDLTTYLAWYRRTGTPRLSAQGRYEAHTRTYHLQLHQHPAPITQAVQNSVLPIPVALSLYLPSGEAVPLRLAGEITTATFERVFVLESETITLIFEDIDSSPVPSLLRGYSAPVLPQFDLSVSDLALLLRADSDGCNRWMAAQALMTRLFDAGVDDAAAKHELTESLAAAIDDATLDPALLAQLLSLPGDTVLAERMAEIDPDYVYARIDLLEAALATALYPRLLARYDLLATNETGAVEAHAQARRRLKNRCLELLCSRRDDSGMVRAQTQFKHAHCMTDRLAALTCLVRANAVSTQHALAAFYTRHADDALALDKWFAVQAARPHADALIAVQALTEHAKFRWNNPNNVYALLMTLGRNMHAFHRHDGAGYRYFGGCVQRLDQINPQVAARLAACFNVWHHYEPQRRALMQQELQRLSALPTSSLDLCDILQRALA